jgi:long-chain acyl-CoA synthetase
MKRFNKIPPLNEAPYISSIQDLILKSSREFGNKIALEDLIEYPIHSVTYKQLCNCIIKFGKSLLALGLEERDHIAIIGANRVQWCIAYLTGMCFNLVVVPLDKNATHNDLLNMIH